MQIYHVRRTGTDAINLPKAETQKVFTDPAQAYAQFKEWAPGTGLEVAHVVAMQPGMFRASGSANIGAEIMLLDVIVPEPAVDPYADTPRTKAALIKKQTNDGIWEAVHATFAQQLERELAVAADLNPAKPLPEAPVGVWDEVFPIARRDLFQAGYRAGRVSRQARIQDLEDYIKKLDGLIEEVGGITVSCINPYEDLKRALIALKIRANEAEAKVAHMAQEGNKTGAEFVGQVEQLNQQLRAAESMEVQIRALANAFTLGTLTDRKVTMAIQAADAFASKRFGSDKGELSTDEALKIFGVDNGLPDWRQRYQALLQILFRWMRAHQGTAEDQAQQTDKLLTLVRALTLDSRSDRSFLEIVNDLFAKQDTRRIDQLQKLVLYKPSVGENKEAVVVFPDNENLETALLEQEGDLRKALDQILSK